jgi:class 3 adenylate cyclase
MPKHDFNILYVDDEEQNLISFKATFRRDYKIFTANSAEEGLELMKQEIVHLIITDQRMPNMTGVQFLEKILPKYPDAIRMVLTGFSDVEAIIDAINNGRVFRYITKPWDENELRMTIENARHMYNLQQKNKTLITELHHKVEEQEKTLKLFMKYVPETVVEKALHAAEDTIFEGESRKIAVLFCDIRGFTSMSEELEPHEVVSFLNDYYSVMTEVVKKCGGAVNQFVGDEVFAAFGAPVAIEDAEYKAVCCAIEMIERIKDLNQKYSERFQRQIEIGIGINSGEVIAGNLGSEDRMEYSLTGDTVNTGKRIESLTKKKANAIYISDSVFQLMGDRFQAKALEPVMVKGKREPLKLYEIVF